MTTKKKIGIIGLGKIGLFHLSILKNCPEVEIVGLVDKNSSAQKMVKGMGIAGPFFSEVSEFIQMTKPDGVFACVPPAFNRVIAEQCVPRGISVFLEKPLAANLKDAQQILKLLQDSKKTITNAVGYMVEYYPTFQHAKKLLNEKVVGEVRHYSASLSLGEVFKKEGGWRQNPEISGGGAIAIVGSHLLYLLQSFLGMPVKVQSNLVKLFSDVEDIAQIRFEYPEKFFGDVYISWSRPGYSEMGFQIIVEGTKGFFEVTENSLSLYTFEGNAATSPGWKVWYPWDLTQTKPDSAPLDAGQQGYVDQDYDFVRSIGSDKQPRVSWQDGLNVQKMLESIYRSGSNPDVAFSLSDLG